MRRLLRPTALPAFLLAGAALAIAAAPLLARPAHAQAPLQGPAAPGRAAPLVMRAENVTAAAEAAAGHARPDARARGGDVLRYHVVFRAGARAVRHVVLADPVPAGLSFVARSAAADRADAHPEYSADNGRTFSAEPVEQTTVDGRPATRPVAPARYTHVRWVVDGLVAPGQTIDAHYDARVGAR